MHVSTRLLVPALLLSAALACATTPRVAVDRLEGVDLSQHESFTLNESPSSAGDPNFGPTARAAARSAVVAELRARGLQFADDPAKADLRVEIAVNSDIRTQGGEIFATPGHTHVVRRRTGLRTPIGDVPLREDRDVVHHGGSLHQSSSYEVTERTVVLDIYEAETDRLVWRGTTRGPRGHKLDAEALRRRVRAIAAEYP